MTILPLGIASAFSCCLPDIPLFAELCVSCLGSLANPGSVQGDCQGPVVMASAPENGTAPASLDFNLFYFTLYLARPCVNHRAQLLFTSYVIIQVALLALSATRGIPKTRLTLACHALTIVGYGILLAVSYLEHLRSVRPSTLLSVYLGTSILLDTPRIRTLFFIPDSQTIARLFLAGFLVKILIFALEVSEKRRLLRPKWQDASPEATSGVINRALFIWLNNVILRGFQTMLTVDTLTPLDADLLDASRPSKLMERWEQCKPFSRPSITSALTYPGSQQIKRPHSSLDVFGPL